MFDIITVGSATVDAFAETDQKYVKKGYYSYPVGSKIQIKELHFDTGGGGTNTAVSFSRLGLKTAWIGNIGTGYNSERVLAQMKKEKVNTSLVCHTGERTGFSVILDAKGRDRTILTYKAGNDDLTMKYIKLDKISTKWIYASSFMGKSFSILKGIFAYAAKKGIKTAFNPSLYMAKLGKVKLKPVLSNTDVLIYNKEEAQALTRKKKIDDLLVKSRALLKKEGIAVITDGANGAYAYDGKYAYRIPARKIKIKETTGAGDAFASTFVAMLAKGKDVYFAMKAALLNSESVITHIGAKNKLLKWPELLKELKICKCKVEMREIKC